MPSFIIRHIDPELWQAVKARAAQEGHPLRWVLLALLREYLTHGLRRPE